jgi:hypothetical protein
MKATPEIVELATITYTSGATLQLARKKGSQAFIGPIGHPPVWRFTRKALEERVERFRQYRSVTFEEASA